MTTYTAATVRAVLGIEPATLRKWVERGHVTRIGRDRYDEESLLAHWDKVAARRPVHTVLPTCGPTRDTPGP